MDNQASTTLTVPRQHTTNTPYMVGPVHCYSTVMRGELILIDTGPPTIEARQYLQDNIDLHRLQHILITHCHIDHYGQAAWLAENTDANIYLPHRDILKITLHQNRMEQMYQMLMEMGFSENYIADLKESLYQVMPPFPTRFSTAEVDIPAGLGIETLPCPGHSQSDLVFVGDTWAVTGDTLLRGIFQSPLLDVDLVTGGRFNNFQAYCESLSKLALLRTKTILPGHRHTIDSVDSIIIFYVSKLLDRIKQLLPYKGEPNTAKVIEQVFQNMTDPFHIYLKASEITFMQDFFEHPELLRTPMEKIGLFKNIADKYHQVAQ